MTWCLCFDLLRIFLVLELMRMVLGPVNPKLARIIRLSSPVPVLIVPVNLIQFRTMVRGSSAKFTNSDIITENSDFLSGRYGLYGTETMFRPYNRLI